MACLARAINLAVIAYHTLNQQPNKSSKVGGEETVLLKNVHSEVRKLISEHENGEAKTPEDIFEFHAKFARESE